MPRNGASAKSHTLEEQQHFQEAPLALFARRPRGAWTSIMRAGQMPGSFGKENKSKLIGVQTLGES